MYRQHLTVCTHAHIFLVACHNSSNAYALAQDVFRDSVSLSDVIPSRTMSLLGVPVLSSPTTLPTEIRPNPCATPLWGGPSGHLASSASTSAVSTHRSTFRPKRAVSTWRMTRQSPPQRILAFLNIHEQAAAGTR